MHTCLCFQTFTVLSSSSVQNKPLITFYIRHSVGREHFFHPMTKATATPCTTASIVRSQTLRQDWTLDCTVNKSRNYILESFRINQQHGQTQCTMACMKWIKRVRTRMTVLQRWNYFFPERYTRRHEMMFNRLWRHIWR